MAAVAPAAPRPRDGCRRTRPAQAARHRARAAGLRRAIMLAAQCIADIRLTGSLARRWPCYGVSDSSCSGGSRTSRCAARALRRPADAAGGRAARRARPGRDPPPGLGGNAAIAAPPRRPTTRRPSSSGATLGVAVFLTVLVVVNDHRVLARSPTARRWSASVLLRCPRCCRALDLGGQRRRSSGSGWAGSASSRANSRRSRLIILLRRPTWSTSATCSPWPAAEFAGLELPRGRDLGPCCSRGSSLLIIMFERDLGSSLLIFGIFVVMLYIATERASWLLIGVGSVRRRRVRCLQGLSRTSPPASTSGSTPSTTGDGRATSWCSRCSAWAPAASSAPGWAPGRPDQVPVAKSDFIASAFGEELGLFGLVAIMCCTWSSSSAPSDFAGRARRLRQAARRRASASRSGLQVFVILGGVTGLIPLTGLTTPFLVLRRFLAGGQLRADRAPDADQRRRPPPGQRPQPKNPISEQTLKWPGSTPNRSAPRPPPNAVAVVGTPRVAPPPRRCQP